MDSSNAKPSPYLWSLATQEKNSSYSAHLQRKCLSLNVLCGNKMSHNIKATALQQNNVAKFKRLAYMFPVLQREEGLQTGLLGFYVISNWFLVGVSEVNNIEYNMLQANCSVSLLMRTGICTSGSIFTATGHFPSLLQHCQVYLLNTRGFLVMYSYTWSPGHLLYK